MTTWVVDGDNDGFGDQNQSITIVACDQPQGFVDNATDCNDDSANAKPQGGIEVCDGLDNDCNGSVDEPAAQGAPTWYHDDDGDGFGDPNDPEVACEAPANHVADNQDCDDVLPQSYPGAPELCDNKDNDCNPQTDEDVLGQGRIVWWTDGDGDTFGDASSREETCFPPQNAVYNEDDCDDIHDDVYPGAPEKCNDTDNNCNGLDDDNAIDMTTWVVDGDNDGFGDENLSITLDACDQPTGFVNDSTDCNDDSADARPQGGTEVCDDLDNDCNGSVDEPSAQGAPTWYHDDDGDGFGDPNDAEVACEAPADHVADNTDCDDVLGESYPGALEICDNEDNDCNAQTDEDVVGIDRTSWWTDGDSDTWGDPLTGQTTCFPPGNAVYNDEDCDDSADYTYPTAPELCDDEDNDCDQDIDEFPTNPTTWTIDRDGDGFGDKNQTITMDACDQPNGYVADHSDCNDIHDYTYPNAPEICDQEDNNCDGTADEPNGTSRTL